MMKIFIIGRPGSGKSEAARHIEKLAKKRGSSTYRINEYDVLQEMFDTDMKHGRTDRFARLDYADGGFDILDFSVLEASLTELETRTIQQQDQAELVIIEFARDDYRQAFSQFNLAFIQNAYFLHIETDVETCALRVYDRAAHPRTPDDHYVSDKIIKNYYKNEGEIQLLSDLAADNNIPDERVKIINNVGSLENFTQQIFSYIYIIFSREEQLLPDTDPAQFVPSSIHDYGLQCE